MDRIELEPGAAWQQHLFEALDDCQKVVSVFSPPYLASKVCKEEFNIAWIRSRETGEEIIFPIYLYSAELPTYMRYRSYFDCREGDQTKLAEASKRLIAALDTGGGHAKMSAVESRACTPRASYKTCP